MKSINSKYLNYRIWYEVNLIIIAALLPFTEYFSTKFASISIILLFVAWLFLCDKAIFFKLNTYEKIILLLFVATYFINITGLFRQDNGITEKVLIKKLSLFILPIIIATSPTLSPWQIKKILFSFIFSLLLSTVTVYVIGIENLVFPRENINDLAEVLLIHRPYYGLFCAFSIIVLVWLVVRKQNFIKSIGYLVIVFYLLFFTTVIYAKMALIALLLSAIGVMLIWLLHKRLYLYSLALIALLFISSAVVYQVKPSLKNNINTILQGKEFSFNEYNILLVGSINTRYINWGCALNVLATDQNWLYGVGPGNSQNKLQECYRIKNLWVYSMKMNAHNQFLDETLYNGIGGLFLFIGSLAMPAFVSFKKGNFLHLTFLILFVLCCLTESVLGRQVGIIFYSFFNSILFFNFKNKIENTNLYD